MEEMKNAHDFVPNEVVLGPPKTKKNKKLANE
jgi:hypothetical protein